MNKIDIINTLNKYNFDFNNYIVISGAAMVLYGIKKETTDIDIAVTKDYYNYLLKNYNCIFERKNENGIDCYLIDNIINFSTTYYTKQKENIKEIAV